MLELNGMVENPLSAHKTAVQKFCRFCLTDCSTTMINIFDAQSSDNSANSTPSLVQRLYEVFQIKYEKSEMLPSNICDNCLNLVESCCAFRESLVAFETELQERYKSLNSKVYAEAIDPADGRSGLNGNPGQFEPDDDCDITEVNPFQEYETSEDDFSMESDSELEVQASGDLPKEQHHQMRLQAGVPGQTANAIGSNISHKDGSISGYTHKPPPPTENRTPNAAVATAVGRDAYTPDYTAARNAFLCQYCDTAFTAQTDCNEHEAKHDPAEPYTCTFCAYRTANRQTLIQHIKEHHDSERPYVCILCNKGFCRRSDLKKHTIVHTGVRPFACPICTKSFSRNTNLTKHMRIHNSGKPHVCQQCPRSFVSALELLQHVNAHKDGKAFQCNYCAAAFTRRDKLVAHEQSVHHRPEGAMSDGSQHMPGAGDSMSMELSADGLPAAKGLHDEHQQQQFRAATAQPRATPKPSGHSRLFTCDICAKTFTRERDLQRHQALHMDALFTCKQCGASFNRRVKLLKHEQETHATQYPCEVCRVTFFHKAELEKHLKAHELQQNVVINTINASAIANATVAAATAASLPAGAAAATTPIDGGRRAAVAADLSFYSQMLPTMNLGFYSETRPEDV